MSLGVSGHSDTQQEGGAGPWGHFFAVALDILTSRSRYPSFHPPGSPYSRCLAINIACTLRERLQTTFIRKAGASKWRC